MWIVIWFTHFVPQIFTKGQIKPKAGLARRRFSQKVIKQIWFVCCEKQKKKQTKQIHLFDFRENLWRASLLLVFSALYKQHGKDVFLFFFSFFADFQMILVWEERPLRKKEFATNQKNARVKVRKFQNVSLIFSISQKTNKKLYIKWSLKYFWSIHR